MLTDTMEPDSTGKFTGSERIEAPAGMRKLSAPENVRGVWVEDWMAGLPAEELAGSASAAAVTGRSDPPKTLLICRRRVSLASVTDTVWRSVESANTRPLSF